MNYLEEQLQTVQRVLDSGLDAKGLNTIFQLIGAPTYDERLLDSFRLWTDYMPLSETHPYTTEQRFMHVLWESIDRVPLGSNLDFALPLRRMIAAKLFAGCGKNFICEGNVRFNFGTNLKVGRDVHFNQGCYIDTKGGVEFGDFSMTAEHVTIFSHGHSESDHSERFYKKVVIGPYAKLGSYCMIMPGVTIGEGAQVAAGAIVTHDVEPYMTVAGSPAKPMRERKTNGKHGMELNHYYFRGRMFQQD